MRSVDFDLTVLLKDKGAKRLHDGYFNLAFSIALAVMAAYLLARVFLLFLDGGSWPTSMAIRALLSFSVLLAFGAYVTAVTFPLYLPGARQISVDSVGIRLTSWSARVETWGWDSRTLRFDLYDYSRVPGWTAPNRLFWIERPPLIPIFTPYHRRTYLTPEAADSILKTVRDLGLTIKVSGAGRRVFPGTPLIYRVTTKKRTSHPGAPTSAG